MRILILVEMKISQWTGETLERKNKVKQKGM